eukprot:6613556-Prymnesium_polylepis.1
MEATRRTCASFCPHRTQGARPPRDWDWNSSVILRESECDNPTRGATAGRAERAAVSLADTRGWRRPTA